MKKFSTLLVVINLLFLLGYMAYSITDKEKILAEGDLVLLKLAPVDPRSLIQGDYMRLNYEISSNIENEIPVKGYCIVQTDSNKVAKRSRMQNNLHPLSADEKAIRYRKQEFRSVSIGAESYFFQEGQAAKFDKAKYGGLRIDKEGNSVLAGLYDDQFRLIK